MAMDKAVREKVKLQDRRLPVALFRRTGDRIERYRHPLHVHPEIEIQLITRHGGTYLIDDELHAVKRHSLVIIQGGEDHKFVQAPQGCDRITLQMRTGWLEDLKPEIRQLDRHRLLTAKQAQALNRLLNRLQAELRDRHAFWMDITRLRVRELILLIRRFQLSGGMPRTKAPVNPLIRQLVDYLDAHFHEPLSLQRLAAHFGYSGFYLSHVFSEALDCSLRDYLKQRRIAEATALIDRDPGLKLGTIAREVGYRDYAGFIRDFSETTGVLPSAYRNT